MWVKESEGGCNYDIEIYVFIFYTFTLELKRKGLEKVFGWEVNRRQAGARLGSP